MKILHYSLGLPPYRSGGLTKYSIDLMKEQVRQGNEVILLFPGVMKKKKVEINYYRYYEGIKVYELENPLPVPLMNGILKPEEFMHKCNKEVFYNFLKDKNVNVVHIHSFMGLYKEFLQVCTELKIKIVYTSHDYFGICTKVNFLDMNNRVCDERNIDKCVLCNSKGNDINKIYMLQSKQYRWLKDKGIVEKVKNLIIKLKKYKEDFINENDCELKKVNRESYIKLLDYYTNMFNSIDKILFNSEVAKQIYSKYIKVDSEIVPITHSDISDNRITKEYKNRKLRVTYLGPNESYKGYNLILGVMDVLYKEFGEDINLNIYGKINSFEKYPKKNVKINGSYSYSDLGVIFKNTDVLVVPSIWYETFGFITLEALSYGVPTIVTDKVGSKDLLDSNNHSKGIIVKDNIKDIVEVIKCIYLNRNILEKLNANILYGEFDYTIEKHCNKIMNIYKGL